MDEQLSEIEKSKLCSIMKLGCDRATACKYFGISTEQLAVELQRDEEFAHNVLRAEAHAEMQHMGNVHKAAMDEKNWRTSVWWLERRTREMEDAASQPMSLPESVMTALGRFAEIIVTEIGELDRRQRVLSQLLQIAEESILGAIEPPVRDAKPRAALIEDGREAQQ